MSHTGNVGEVTSTAIAISVAKLHPRALTEIIHCYPRFHFKIAGSALHSPAINKVSSHIPFPGEIAGLP